MCQTCLPRLNIASAGAGASAVEPWKLPRQLDGVSGIVSRIMNPFSGRYVQLHTGAGARAEREEARMRRQWEEFPEPFRDCDFAWQPFYLALRARPIRSVSPPARRNRTPTPPPSPPARRNPSPERIVIRSQSPVRRQPSPEAQMVVENTIIQLPWDAEYAESFNRAIRESTTEQLWTLRSPDTQRVIPVKRSRKERSATSSQDGIGLYKCVGDCGKNVAERGGICDRCDDEQDVQAEQDDEEERDDITETDFMTVSMDNLDL